MASWDSHIIHKMPAQIAPVGHHDNRLPFRRQLSDEVQDGVGRNGIQHDEWSAAPRRYFSQESRAKTVPKRLKQPHNGALGRYGILNGP